MECPRIVERRSRPINSSRVYADRSDIFLVNGYDISDLVSRRGLLLPNSCALVIRGRQQHLLIGMNCNIIHPFRMPHQRSLNLPVRIEQNDLAIVTSCSHEVIALVHIQARNASLSGRRGFVCLMGSNVFIGFDVVGGSQCIGYFSLLALFG